MTRVSDEDLEALESYNDADPRFAAMKAELLALRKTWNIKRCDKWHNDGQDAADPARRCRLAEGHETDCDFGELERVRAENEKLRKVADAAVALRDNRTLETYEEFGRALREAGR